MYSDTASEASERLTTSRHQERPPPLDTLNAPAALEQTEDERLLVEVPGFTDHDREDGTKYTTYEVLVHYRGHSWRLHKRYSEFDRLREAVKGCSATVDRFRFPHKSKFNTFSEFTKERRRSGFEDWLMLLAKAWPRPAALEEFVELAKWREGGDEASGGAAAGNGSAFNQAGDGNGRSAGGAGQPVAGTATIPRPRNTPRFPPLADKAGFHEPRRRPSRNAGEIKAAAGAASASPPREARTGASRPSGPQHGARGPLPAQLDAALRRLFSPVMLSVLVVLVCTAVTVVAVWKISGKVGIVTLVVGVSVGLVIQNKGVVMAALGQPHSKPL